MEIEHKKLTPEQNKIATALSSFYLQYKTTNNLERINKKLDAFIKKNNILPELSTLYGKISSGELSSNVEICNEIQRIYKDVLGLDMTFESPKEKILEPEPIEDSKVESSNETMKISSEPSTFEVITSESSSTQEPQTLAEKLKVDVQPIITPKDNNTIVNDTSFSFTRPDGSKVTMEVLDHVKNLYYSQLHTCRITQVFPNLPHGSNIEVVTTVTTAIDLETLKNSPEYMAILKIALSAQNIYDATANHSTFLYKGIPTFNQSSQEILEYTEHQLEKKRLDAAPPFNSHDYSFERLIPVCEFHTPSPLPDITQYEYSVSNPHSSQIPLKYIYSNIEFKKLLPKSETFDYRYKDFILAQIAEANNNFTTDRSFFMINEPNIPGNYATMSDSSVHKFIEAYNQYVTSAQLSTDDSNPGDKR